MSKQANKKLDLLTFEDLLDADWYGISDVLKAEALKCMLRRFRRASKQTSVGPWGLEDIAMSALVDAYKKWRPAEMDFVSYAVRRVRNLTQTIWRSPDYRRRAAADIELLPQAALLATPEDPRVADLFDGLSHLPVKHRTWIRAVCQDPGAHPLSQREVARAIGVSEATSSRIRKDLEAYIALQARRRQPPLGLKGRPDETPEWCCSLCGKMEWMWVDRNPGFACQCQRCGADALQATATRPLHARP